MGSFGFDPGTPCGQNNQERRRKVAKRHGFPQRGQNLLYRLDQWLPLQASDPKFPVLPSPNHLIIPSGSDVWSVLPYGHIILSLHMGWSGVGWFDFPCPFQSVDMPKPSHHAELALYSDDTAILATSQKPMLHVSYLEFYLTDSQRWLSEWKIAINLSKSNTIIFMSAGQCFVQSRPVKSFGEPIQWVDKLVIWEWP